MRESISALEQILHQNPTVNMQIHTLILFIPETPSFPFILENILIFLPEYRFLYNI